jgi:Fur family peroxide stress response transcriptional regulator
MTTSKEEINFRLEKFRQISKAKRLPLTPQKLAIFRTLASSCSHPQVQDIYKQVKIDFPNISLATVYKNLIKFQELGLIMEIPLAGAPSRYDAKLQIHSHAVDTDSGLVYDLEENSKLNLPKKIKGKTVKRTEIIYYL